MAPAPASFAVASCLRASAPEIQLSPAHPGDVSRLLCLRSPPPAISPPSERVGASGAFSPGRRSRRRGGYPPLPRKAQLRELAGPAVMHGVVRPLAESNEIPRLPRPARIILRRVHMMHHRGCRRHGRISRSLPAALVPPKDSFPQPLPSVALVVHLKPPGKRKKPAPTITPLRERSLALALKALALFDIDFDLVFTSPAEHRQISGGQLRRDPQQPPRTTHRTFQPAISDYQHFTIFFLRLQAHPLPYPKVNIIIKAEKLK